MEQEVSWFENFNILRPSKNKKNYQKNILKPVEPISLKVHRKNLFMEIFRKIILIKICFEKIRVRLQGPCTRLQKSVHVAALLSLQAAHQPSCSREIPRYYHYSALYSPL